MNAGKYIFDSESAQGREQVDHLCDLLDGITTGFLRDLGVLPHWQCLDIGAGTGSVARWLAGRAGVDGRVVAVDIDTEQLDVPAQVEVYRHDVRDELPMDGPFDLIHARLVLTHVPNREVVLRRWIDLLAPGGWIVLGETPDRPQEVLDAPTAADAQLADRVVNTAIECGRRAGVAVEWAYEVEQHLSVAGLTDICGVEYSPMVRGGDTGGRLMAAYIAQLAPLLLDAGVSADELDRYDALMHDPRFRAWPFLRLVTTAGRKPLEGEVDG